MGLEIDAERCKGCGYCVDVCPRDVLVMTSAEVNGAGYLYVVVKDSDDCTECGLCLTMCSDNCIEGIQE